MRVKYVDVKGAQNDEWYGPYTNCPNCGHYGIWIPNEPPCESRFKFCPYCGQKLYYRTPKKKTK